MLLVFDRHFIFNNYGILAPLQWNFIGKILFMSSKETHRHLFNGLFSGTLDFNEARDDGVAVASAGQ